MSFLSHLTVIQITGISVALIAIALILIIDLRPRDFYDMFDNQLNRILNYIDKRNTHKKTMREVVTGKQRKTFIQKQLTSTIFNDRTELGRSKAKQLLTTIIFLSLVLVFINRGWLIIPIIYVLVNVPVIINEMIKNATEKKRMKSLHKMMSMVTATYCRGNSTIIQAFEENIGNMDAPYKQYCEYFIFANNELDHSLENNLEELAKNVNNFIFTEWTKAIIQCKGDYSLNVILHPIVNKLSFILSTQTQMEAMLNKLRSDLLIMSIFYFIVIPLFQFMDSSWLPLLFGTSAGNMVLSITCTVVLVCIHKGIETINATDYQKALKGGN